jgi:hypothetical protein
MWLCSILDDGKGEDICSDQLTESRPTLGLPSGLSLARGAEDGLRLVVLRDISPIGGRGIF